MRAASGLVLVWFGSYAIFEKIMTVLVGVMFVVVVGLAILVLPDVPAMLAGLLPVLPAGSGVYTLGLVGGVGGTVTMAAYGYWINAKGWRDSSWMRVMRLDNRVAYITTGIFVAAMLVVGAELLYTANIALVESDRGLLDLDEILHGPVAPESSDTPHDTPGHASNGLATKRHIRHSSGEVAPRLGEHVSGPPCGPSPNSARRPPASLDRRRPPGCSPVSWSCSWAPPWRPPPPPRRSTTPPAPTRG